MSSAPSQAAHDELPVLMARDLHIAASGTLPSVNIDFRLFPGELHLVHSRRKDRSSAIADALLGLSDPGRGAVSYLDRDWRELDAEESFALRRSVGRVQSQGNWMETRTVMENLLLPSRHNSVIPDQLLRERASNLAQRFGLPGLPLQLPSECAPADLESAACVRAFLGRPTLVILEHPMEFQDSALLLPMIDALQQVRRRGGSVIWFSEHMSLVTEPSIPADHRYRIVGGRLLPLRPAQ